MNSKRREFLRLTANLAAGLAIVPLACNSASNDDKAKETGSADSTAAGSPTADAGTAITTFGLQLYTLRDDLPKDPKGVLKQVSTFGYKQVEGYEGKDGE